MALIEIKSRKTGEISTVPQSAYDSYIKATGLYTVIEKNKKPIVEEKPIKKDLESVPVDNNIVEEKKQKPVITPIKPLKVKGDDSKINSEV